MLGTNPISATMGAGSSVQGGDAGPATSGNNMGGNVSFNTGGKKAGFGFDSTTLIVLAAIAAGVWYAKRKK